MSRNNPKLEHFFDSYKDWPPKAIKPEDVQALKDAVVVLSTTRGDIHIKVFPDSAPIHSANFVKLAASGFYDGVTFHRVIPGFMTQGGDPREPAPAVRDILFRRKLSFRKEGGVSPEQGSATAQIRSAAAPEASFICAIRQRGSRI